VGSNLDRLFLPRLKKHWGNMKSLRAILTVLLSLISSISSASTGTITGVVVDKLTGEPLTGATVYIEELQFGSATDSTGMYLISVSSGTYHLHVSYIGYASTAFEVGVSPSQLTIVNFVLEGSATSLQGITIESRRNEDGNFLSSQDLKRRSPNYTHDVLKFVPGLFVAQHSGGGKAEQIFLRGFDVDHGSDINIEVDGIPVNMVSHAHGQGYADTHFIIPETISSISFEKGPYSSAKGNFATAGYVSFQTIDYPTQNIIKLEGGSYGLFRNTNIIRIGDRNTGNSHETIYAGVEYLHNDGFFQVNLNLNRVNLMTKYVRKTKTNNKLSVTLSTYATDFNSPGQIPERAVRKQMLSRYGSVDTTEGGNTSRSNILVTHRYNFQNAGTVEQSMYASKYDFNLTSNFTFFHNDSVDGDQINQNESRILAGYRAEYNHESNFLEKEVSSTYGISIRYDKIRDLRLSHSKNATLLIEELKNGTVDELSSSAYTKHTMQMSNALTLTAALRYDVFSFKYVDNLSAIRQSSNISRGVLSPKALMEYRVSNKLSLYAKAGYGFHSNDARVVTQENSYTPLAKAFSSDVGMEYHITENLFIQSAIWMLKMEDELVYVGDEGIVESIGKTSRNGLDFSLRYAANANLSFDMDWNLCKPRLVGGEAGKAFVPLAPTLTSIGGVNYDRNKINASVRYRYLKDRPANEDYSLTATGYVLADAQFRYSFSMFTFSFSVENILNAKWKEVQFETESRLSTEAQSVNEINFTTGTPRCLRIGFEVRF
jgi:outer membrane receptor protein involved in Fe transport